MTGRGREGQVVRLRRDGSRPVIRIQPGKLHEMTTQTEQHLIEAETPFFVRGDKIVRPIVQRLADSAGRITKSAALVTVDRIHMRDRMSSTIDWHRYNRGEREWVPANAPEDVAMTLLGRVGLWDFPPIAGVISTPTLRPDGSILSEPGYDATTALYVLNPVPLPAMPDKPTRADALAALALLGELLDEFPFVNDASRSVALSAMLTAVARGCMDVAPAHGARAPTAGTGKSFLFDIVAAIVLGHRCPVIGVAPKEDETEKRVIAKALSGHPLIHLDNVNGTLGGDALCQLISQPICDFRIFGALETVRLVNRACVFFNGNNCRVQGDMTRRVLLADLDARMEKPAEREFSNDPVKTVLRDRGRYIAAIMTILRAYIAAGRPKVTKMPMNSFDDWSNSVRSPLIWLGEADPCDTIQKARDEDPELQQLSTFLEALKGINAIGAGQARTSSELINLADQTLHGDHMHPDLREALMPFYRSGQFNSQALGTWLTKVQRRVVDGFCLSSQVHGHKKVKRWFAEAL